MRILLDTFCKAGGATKGYQRAGFYVVGVDIEPQPHYCGDEFYQADALDFISKHGAEFYAIHASPPCQGYSRMRFLPWLKNREYKLLIDPVRKLLIQTGRIWVIENVSDAPLNGPELCGLALGLNVIRHRRFESSQLLLFPPCPGHPVVFSGPATMSKRGQGAGVMGVIGGDARSALGIDWMTNMEMRQAVPPAYTELIGKQLL